MELAALAGLRLDEWQQTVLRHSLGEGLDGKWAARTVGLVVGRQNGKGAILEARELAGLFLLGEQVIIHTAHLQKTATAHFKRLRNLIRAVPEFNARVLKMPEGKGNESIELRTGQTIFFATRSGGGGRGLTADLLVFDEAMYLSEDDRSALVPTMAARSMDGNIQTWYTGSAVDQRDSSQDGVPFAKVREAAMAGNASTAFFEWSLDFPDPDHVPFDVMCDPESARLTNPGFGVRISADWVGHERTVEMSRRGFCVERLGVGDWPMTSEESGRVIDRRVWESIAERDPENRIVSAFTFCVDVNPERTKGSIAVAGRREDGLWQFALAEYRPRTDWLVEACSELNRTHVGARFLVLARGHAENLVPDLEDEGLHVDLIDRSDYGVACADFFDAIDRRQVRYPDPQPEIDEALAGARRSAQIENAWSWSRKASTSPDISPLVAVTVALWGARQGESQFATVMFPSDERPSVQGDGEDPMIGPSWHQIGARAPKVLTPEDVTECFACKVGGCKIHGG